MKNKELIMSNLDIIIPNPVCELNYNKDYELLIAILLSAQCTDKRVNIVTNKIFSKYDLEELDKLSVKDIEKLIYEVGTYKKKSEYIKNLTHRLITEYNGIVPCNKEYLESLDGVGRKTANVFLAEYYNIPTMPVDTHVERVSKRLGLVKKNDNVLEIEKKLMRIFPEDKWIRLHKQLVLFGRYHCKSIKPKCNNCLFIDICKKNS